MKFSPLEEYGLRCLLRIAKDGYDKGLTIPEISKLEGMSSHNVGKLLRLLRIGGLLESSRGQIGGYTLTKPPDQIFIKDVLNILGGKLYDQEFCNIHSGIKNICTNSIDCSIRSLWQMMQNAIDDVLDKLTLKDLISSGDLVVTNISLPQN